MKEREPMEMDLHLPVPIAHDEMNLAENPFSWLTDRPDPAVKTLEFSYPLRGKQATWTITGSDKYGLPLPGDEDILLILIQLTQERGLESRALQITRQEILRRLKGDKKRFSGPEYQRIQDALFRIQGTQISATHWYNYRLRRHVNFAGGIIEEVVLVEEGPGRRGRNDQLPLSYIVWTEQFFNSLRSGYVKSLDLEQYLSFSRPITKKLYRFLSKKFLDRKPRFEMNLRVLAHEHLGIQRSYPFDSYLKKVFTPAHDDLIRIGFLKEVEYRKSKDGIIVTYHRGPDEMVFPARPEAPAPAEVEAVPADPAEAPAAPLADAALVEELLRAGITPRRVAEDLVQRFPERAPLALKYLNWREAKKPPAYLRTAIESDWFDEEIRRAREREEEEERKRREKQARRKRREEAQVEQESELRLKAALEALPAAAAADLRTRAETNTREKNPHAAHLYDRGRGKQAWRKLVDAEYRRLVLNDLGESEG